MAPCHELFIDVCNECGPYMPLNIRTLETRRHSDVGNHRPALQGSDAPGDPWDRAGRLIRPGEAGVD